jgi:flavocytochrome c
MMPTERHVIVIGGGLAGLCAAISAAESGVRVTLFERSVHLPSGASLAASSGLSAALDLNDVTLFEKDLKTCAGLLARPNLISTLAKGSLSSRQWLADHGAPLLTRAIQTGGHTVARTWLPPAGGDDSSSSLNSTVGTILSISLANEVSRQSLITVRRNNAVKKLLLHSSIGEGIAGVQCEGGEEIKASAVVIATGGFGAAPEMLPLDLREFPYSSARSADGSGIKLAKDIDAALVDMKMIQLHPTAFASTGVEIGKREHLWLAPEGLRGCGGILLDPHSFTRFYNELEQRDKLTDAILKLPNRLALLCFPAIAANCAPGALFHEASGRLKRVHGSQGLVNWVFDGLNTSIEAQSTALANLNAEFEQIATIARRRGESDLFGRHYFGEEGIWDGASLNDLLVARVTPAIHYTLGGISINENAAVLDSMDKPIVGLFAAGEVTGGVHGACRLAGAALADTVVFGRIAGEKAAAVHTEF